MEDLWRHRSSRQEEGGEEEERARVALWGSQWPHSIAVQLMPSEGPMANYKFKNKIPSVSLCILCLTNIDTHFSHLLTYHHNMKCCHHDQLVNQHNENTRDVCTRL